MSRVPSHLKASLDINAVPPIGAGGDVSDVPSMARVGEPGPEMVVIPAAANVENVEAAPSHVPTHEIDCACGQILVHVDHVSHVAILHVFERNVLRPHVLVDADLPLNWRCNACGQVTVIGAVE